MQTRKFRLHDFAGATLLSREEMKNVKGGVAPPGGGSGGTSCTITNTQSNGASTTWSVSYDSSWSCSSIEGTGTNSISSIADGKQLQYGGSTHYTCPACNAPAN